VYNYKNISKVVISSAPGGDMTLGTGRSDDPFDRLTEPAPVTDAAAYLIEMLSSMAHFAHISDLHNSSVMLAAASQIVDQECRLLTSGPPNFVSGEAPQWPYPNPFSDQESDEPGSG